MQDSKLTIENWHAYWLMMILAVAASVRFYALGENNLTAESLFNASFCDVNGWFAMVKKYTGATGLPFVYPTFLCQFADVTASVDFFIRAFSVVMGVGLVFMVYLFGQRFLSPLTGLLAATVIAVDYQGILINRSVTPYSLFALLCLAHLYIYCSLLWSAARTPAPLEMGVGQASFQFKLRWAPDCPCHAGALLLFWGSGLLAFYTNPTALVIFIVEAIGVCLFVARGYRRKLSLWLWLPVFLGSVPYLLMLVARLGWAFKSDLLGWFVLNRAWLSNLLLFSNADNKVSVINVIVFSLSLVVVVALCFYGKYRKNHMQFFAVIGMLIVSSCVSLSFIKVIDARSFLFCMVLLSLLLVEGFSQAVMAIKSSAVQNVVLFVFVFVLAGFQMRVNTQDGLYTRSVDKGFEWAAQIIAADGDFMRSKKTVLINSRLFEFYLARYDVTQTNVVLLKEAESATEGLSPVGTDFYYLEYTRYDAGFLKSYPVYEDFSRKYKKVCVANKKRFRITRFSTASPPTAEPVVNCSDYLKEEGSVL